MTNQSNRSYEVIPENVTYSRVPDKDCVGGYYVTRTNTSTETTKRVAYSGITDTDSTYVLKTVNDEDATNEYWDLGSGWDHIDDFLYNAAFHIFRRINKDRFFKIIVNLGRIKDLSDITIIATETYEQSISILVPADHRELDTAGLAGEESITSDTPPVMFSPNDVLEELYWVMREFSADHAEFRRSLEDSGAGHDLQRSDSLRAYQALTLAYPFFEGLVYQLTDRVRLKNKPFKNTNQIQFRYLESTTPRDNPKNLIQNTLYDSFGVLSDYEQEFLIDTYYNESINLGIDRNELAHNIYDATRGFQSIDWRELARRLIVSIAFLDEKVVCTYSPVDATNLQVFEEWLQQREQEGFESIRNIDQI